MEAVGLLVLVTGAYLLESSVVNRKPIQTLIAIIRNPTAARTSLATSRQTGQTYGVFQETPSAGSTSATTGSATGSVQGQAALAFAKSQIGKPYKWGATGPNAFDCSGLAQAAYKAAGVSIPRTTAGQRFIGSAVAKNNLAIGDLVFPDLHHVQIYAGGGQVVEAPRTGLKVRQVPMWGFAFARRPVTAGKRTGGGSES